MPLNCDNCRDLLQLYRDNPAEFRHPRRVTCDSCGEEYYLEHTGGTLRFHRTEEFCRARGIEFIDRREKNLR